MVIQLTAEMKEGLATNSYSLLTGYKIVILRTSTLD